MSNVPTNLIPTTVTGLPEYTGSSTLGYLPYVVEGRTYKVQFSNIAAVGAVPSSRTIATGTGLTGGGDLSANRTIAIANGGVGTAQLAASVVSAGVYGSGTLVPVLTVDATGRVTSATTAAVSVSGFVPTSRSVIAGTGLTGGGALTSDVTLNVNFSSSTPQALGTATAGVSTAAARGDHVHPAVDLADTSQTQGALPLGRGGTGDALSPVAGAVVYSTGTRFALTALGLPGQVLMSDGANAPQWATVSGIGTVTSVNVSGGTTGLTFSGGPVTAAGTITMAGTLAVGNGGTGLTTLAANFVPKGNGTAAFSASQIFDNGTNVGIGTSSPGAKLAVVGTTKVGEGVASNTSKLMVNTLSGVAAGIQLFQDANESWIIQNPAASTVLTFSASGNERMRITSAGLVGIGTASPGYRLDVANADGSALARFKDSDSAHNGIVISGDVNGGWIGNNLQITGEGIYCQNSINAMRLYTNSLERMRITSGGELCVGRTSSLNTGVLSVLGTGTQAITAQVTVNGNSLIQGYSSSTSLSFQVIGTGQAYFADNVGIGVLAPAARIHTNGGSGGINAIFESNTASETRIEYRNNATRAGYLYWDANEVRHAADPTRSLTSYTNGVERMRILSSGEVGIGTIAPVARLTVGTGNFALTSLGAGSIGSTPATGTQKMVLGGNSATGVGNEIGWYPNTSFSGDTAQITSIATALGVSSAGALLFRTNSGAQTTPGERMRIDATGLVGIGTSSPQNLLHLESASPVIRLRDTDAAAGVYATISGDNTTGSIFISADSANAAASSTIAFLVDGTERMRIDSANAVVLPKLTLSSDTPFLTGANINSAANPLAIGTTGSGVVAFFTNNAERMRAKANGQVRFVPLAAAPLGAEAGDVYYDSTTNKLRCYNGTTWNDLF